MRRYGVLAFWCGILILLMGFGIRLAWVVGSAETGWTQFTEDWRDAAIDCVADPPVSVGEYQPADQAEFWLREADRVLAQSPHDAELAAGAACLLDKQGRGFYIRRALASTGYAADEFERMMAAFELRANQRCVELAARATELDSTNPQWWRLRALLLDSGVWHADDRSPRSADWHETLEECAAHDPHNALYDYLAALIDWRASSKRRYTDNSGFLEINDPVRFERGIRHFEQGQQKPRFEAPETAQRSVDHFLKQTRIPLTQRPAIINSQEDRSNFLVWLVQWQSWRASRQIELGNLNKAEMLYRQQLHMAEQTQAGGPNNFFHFNMRLTTAQIVESLHRLAIQHPEEFPPAEIRAIQTELTRLQIEGKVIDEAVQLMSPGDNHVAPRMAPFWSLQDIAWHLTSMVAAGWTLAGLLIAALAWPASRLASREQLLTVGPVGLVSALVTACIITGLGCGVAPGGGFSTHIPPEFWSLVGVVVLVVFLIHYRLATTTATAWAELQYW